MTTAPLLLPQFVPPIPEAWRWDAAVIGKIVELSGSQQTARSSAAVALMHAAQAAGELTAWIQPAGGRLYPPDLAASGIDLAALLVVHVPPSAGPHGMPKAAEILLRSGAYGLVIIDWSYATPPVQAAAAWQGRLLGLARAHQSSVILLTHKTAQTESMGPLVSVRLEPQRSITAEGQYVLTAPILKNKSGAPLQHATVLRRAPCGMESS